jgi:phosphoribosylformimino-5-aminoimidazole carboxamide ribotide isomerase
MATFELLPAIDLRAGRVVRLREGDFEHETAYSEDPVATALDLVRQGSRWLHVVDLDGARAGEPAHGPLIARLIAAVSASVRVEVGGGIRDAAAARRYIKLGAARVVLGTAALGSSQLIANLVAEHGAGRIVVALDVRGREAVGNAWQAGDDATDVDQVVRRLSGDGVISFEVTAIDRDGALSGPDLGLLTRVRALAPAASIIASGGIRSIDDLLAVRASGCSGAIVGTAIYERTLDLATAVRALDT